MIKRNIGKYIKQARESQGYSQRELASIMGMSSGTIASWEINRTEPNESTIDRLALILGVTTDFLLGYNDMEQSNIIRYLKQNSDFPELLIGIVAIARKMNQQQLEKLSKFANLINQGEL